MMKTMQDYTIYCTPKQTRKALELGAPIPLYGVGEIYRVKIDGFYYEIPTAEQMIGWLEEKVYFSDITIEKYEHHWRWFIFGKCRLCSEDKKHNSRKEATIAAIDAALEYLISNKK